MNAFFHALTFLTRIPVPWLRASDAAWKNSVAYYPLVGFVIGLVLWCFHFLVSQLFPPMLASVLLLVCWVYLTGGLHLDGWMDLADGLGSNRSRERTLEIMKDSRVGAMGVLAALLLLLVKSAAIAELFSEGAIWFLVIPAIARMMLLPAIHFWPYVTPNGMATGMKAGLKNLHLAGNALMLTATVIWIGGLHGLFILVISCIGSMWFSYRIAKRLGGLTGDCYGAIIEWTEVLSLVVILGMGRWLS